MPVTVEDVLAPVKDWISSPFFFLPLALVSNYAMGSKNQNKCKDGNHNNTKYLSNHKLDCTCRHQGGNQTKWKNMYIRTLTRN